LTIEVAVADKRDDRDNSDKSFSIHQMEIADLAEVFELGQLVFRANRWPMLYRIWDEYEVTSLFNTDGDYCLVAENDDEEATSADRICGFILGTVISKPGSAWSYGYVIWLCAHPDWQREGVAGKLLDKLVEIMIDIDGTRIIMADTDPLNVPAVRFFQKKGFTDEKPHLYLTSNLENNERYAHLLKASRAEKKKPIKKKKKAGSTE
jgi:ribosomal protein S18 acetylase RimI-like enzyme